MPSTGPWLAAACIAYYRAGGGGGGGGGGRGITAIVNDLYPLALGGPCKHESTSWYLSVLIISLPVVHVDALLCGYPTGKGCVCKSEGKLLIAHMLIQES